jgi:hypothetical protein
MFLNQLKTVATAVLVVLTLGAGVGGLAVRSLAAGGPDGEQAPPAKAGERLTVPGWGTAVDPDGDCKFTVEKGKLTITVPGGDHDIAIERPRMNSPRVLLPVAGDFIAQVRVSGDYPKGATSNAADRTPYFGAGLLLWQDEKTYVRLERADLVSGGQNHHYASWELRKAGEWVRAGDASEKPLADGPTWLRLERRGARVFGSVGTDGVNWTALEPIEVELPRDLRVGVSAGHDTPIPFSPTFEGFQLFQAIAGRPLEEPPAGALLMTDGSIRMARSRLALSSGVLHLHGIRSTLSGADINAGRMLANVNLQPNVTLSGTGVLQSGSAWNVIPKTGEGKPASPPAGETAVAPGQVITFKDVKNVEQLLGQLLNLKRSFSVKVVDAADGKSKDIVVTVEK